MMRIEPLLPREPTKWLAGFGIAAIVGVWFDKLESTTSNLTLLSGVLALTLAVFLSRPLARRGLGLRLLISASVFCVRYPFAVHPLGRYSETTLVFLLDPL
jgi:hypothetical protein